MAAVLLMDDNVAFVEIMAQVLTHAGHQAWVANGGQEGLRLLDQHPVDLVITDVVMPGQDGIETILRLRKTHPKLPVIVMSGDSPRHAALYLSTAQKLGALKTLAKPFSAATLLNAVTEALHLKPADESPKNVP